VQRAAALEPRLPKLVIRLAPDVPSGAVVKRGDVTIGRASLDTPIPVDPGKHRLLVEAAGREPSALEVTIDPAKTLEVTLTAGPELPAAPAARTEPPPISDAPRDDPGGGIQVPWPAPVRRR